METFLKAIAEDFGLTMPIKFKLTASEKVSGMYANSLDGDTGEQFHKVKVSFFFNPTMDKMKETIIHELIHCWQYENGKRVGHGKSFKKWVQYYKSLGYEVD